MTKNTGLHRQIIESVRRGFHAIGLDIHRHRPSLDKVVARVDILNALVELRHESHRQVQADEEIKFLEFCRENLQQSHAQLLQDLFVLYELQGKRNGYFVEFGATDGVSINNTVLLERQYGWTGVVAEPARYWHERLKANRQCFMSTDCVWRTTGETLIFNETPDRELSTLDDLSDGDGHRHHRVHGERYEVQTVSLLDLLRQAGSPPVIDYLSVDTEGSEFEILKAFDFDAYDVRLITVEHNFTPSRALLHDLLTRHGYSRKFASLSRWDDWYVRSQK